MEGSEPLRNPKLGPFSVDRSETFSIVPNNSLHYWQILSRTTAAPARAAAAATDRTGTGPSLPFHADQAQAADAPAPAGETGPMEISEPRPKQGGCRPDPPDRNHPPCRNRQEPFPDPADSFKFLERRRSSHASVANGRRGSGQGESAAKTGTRRSGGPPPQPSAGLRARRRAGAGSREEDSRRESRWLKRSYSQRLAPGTGGGPGAEAGGSKGGNRACQASRPARP